MSSMEGRAVADLIYLAIGLACFAALIGYAQLCAKL